VIVARLIPVGSNSYRCFQQQIKFLDLFKPFGPKYWFGFWCMVLSGTQMAYAEGNRWLYWDFSAVSFLVILALFLVIPWTRLFLNSPQFPKRVQSFKDVLFILGIGFVLYAAGTLDHGFHPEIYVASIPYLLLFLANWLVFSIPLARSEDGRWVAPPSKPVSRLGIVVTLTLAAVWVGFLNDDPVSSTAAAVYLPFTLVALVFRNHARHYQRARIYGVFIPAVFIGMRLPWFFIPLIILFWGLRYYHYFRSGEVFPTFKVDLE